MKRYLLSSFIFFLCLCGAIMLIYSRCTQIQDNHLQQHLTTEQAAINSSIHTYSLLAQAINDEVIQTEPVLKLVHAISTSQGKEQNIQRGKLYRLLYPVYQRLRGKQVRQLHFHFPDSRSMLRFHAPSRSDDSLVNTRPSVVKANTSHEIVNGFESGKIFHGFRHVYPLSYQGQHIGSVEISTSFYQIREEFKHLAENDLNNLDNSNETQLAFLLYRPEMWNKLFQDLHTFYQTTPLHRDYIIERADLISSLCSEDISVSPLVDKIQQKLAHSSRVAHQLDQHRSFALAINLRGATYTVVFHSVQNTLGQHAAYIMSVTPEPFIASIRNDGILMGALATVLLTIILLYRFRFLAADENEKRQALFLSNISDNLGTALYTTNHEGTITFTNTAMEFLLGYQQQEMLGRNAHELFHQPHAKDDHSLCICEEVLRTNTTIRSDAYHFVDRTGALFPVEVVCSPLRDHKQTIGTATIFQDISKRREQEEQLQRAQQELISANASLKNLASHDGLTGVYNRRSFDEQVERLWRSAARHKQPLALLMVDIDHFKRYNDLFGHLQGDACLRLVAQALQKSCKRPEDFVARYGGEEFAILLPLTGHDDSEHVAQRIQAQIASLAIAHPGNEKNQRITLSIGCCTCLPDGGKTVQDFIFAADQCLYQAKEEGRNTICCCRLLGDEEES
jgi:diguanylate cyclase (GGDEF)-like protein/PAS domain S-box-containing protein